MIQLAPARAARLLVLATKMAKPRVETLGAKEGPLHQLADSHTPKLSVAIRYAFASARAAMRPALQSREDIKKATALGIVTLRQELRDVLPKALRKIYVAGGELAANSLLKTLGGPGSGNFGHSGRPGEVGGSSSDGSGTSPEDIKSTTWYHASTSADISEFRHDKMRGNDLDAPYTGVWLSEDEMTSPAMVNPTTLYTVQPQKVEKTLTRPEANRKSRAYREEPDFEEKYKASGAHGFSDYVRRRLVDEGYDVIVHEAKPVINQNELEHTGSTRFMLNWREHELRKEPLNPNDPNSAVSYDLYSKHGEHITGYSSGTDLIDSVRRQIVVLDPKNAKITEKRVSPWVRRDNSFRTAKREPTAKIDFSFDDTDENAVSWADKHAAELIDGISETSREDINNAVAEFLESGDFAELRDEILAAVGDVDRADRIARNEPMVAVHEGQRAAWDQAVEAGLLPEAAVREWIIVGDDKVCPICEALEGKTAALGEEYEDGIEGPPAHVMCRCSEGLSSSMRELGGAGSGNFGHSGRPGEVGGSSSGSADEVDSLLNQPAILQKLNVPDVMYHVTSAANAQQILKDGLKPNQERSSTVGQPRGMYLTPDPSGVGKEGGDITGDTVLEIRTKGLDLRLDPEYFYYDDKSTDAAEQYMTAVNEGSESFALYSKSEIPAEAIKVREKRTLGGRGSGNYGHSGRPGQIGGSSDEDKRSDNNPTERAKRAAEAHNPFTKEKDAWATKNEEHVVSLLNGEGTANNAPVDVVTEIDGRTHGIEVKTMLDNKASKITVRKDALARKISWSRKNKASLHTLVIDDRDKFGKKDLHSGHRLYYMKGSGSFRIGSMIKVRDEQHLRELIAGKRR